MLPTTASQSKSARALPGGGKRLLVVLGHLLDGVAGVLGRELGHERPDGNPVRLLVPHRLHIAGEPLLVELFHRGRHNNITLSAWERFKVKA